MTKLTFRSLLALYILVLGSWIAVGRFHEQAVFSALPAVQGALWNASARGNVFLALHALMFAVCGGALGIAGLWLFWSPGRSFFAASIVSLLLYYALEPRAAFDLEPWRFSLSFVLPLLVGFLTPFLFSERHGSADTGAARTAGGRLLGVLGVPCGLLLALVGSRAAYGSGDVRVLLQPRSLHFALLMFLVGSILQLSAFGAAKSLFESENGSSVVDGSVRKTFFVHHALYFVLSGVLLVLGGLRKLLWLPATPFVPWIMAIYSPYTWFTSPEQSGLFFSSAANAQVRGRFFLGILFEYLAVGTTVLVWRAVRRKRRDALFYLAHVATFLYWLPTLWLVRMIALMFDSGAS